MQNEQPIVSRVRKIMADRKFFLSHNLGQNFLIDETIPNRIVEAACIDKTCGVIEIGPGFGVMTESLCQLAAKVVAVELDSRLIPILQENLASFSNLVLINQDILKTDLPDLIEKHFSGLSVHVCANLPYYITTPIIMSLLEGRLAIRRIVVTVQKEVAVRLCAAPGSKECGAVSYAVSYYAKPHMLFDIPPACFLPPPKVTSCVIALDILDMPSVSCPYEKQMFSLISAGFSQRRKTLKNALSSANFDKNKVGEALALLNLSQDIRAERLTLDDFAKLTVFLNES